MKRAGIKGARSTHSCGLIDTILPEKFTGSPRFELFSVCARVFCQHVVCAPSVCSTCGDQQGALELKMAVGHHVGLEN